MILRAFNYFFAPIVALSLHGAALPVSTKNISVTIRVVDEKGQPVPYATIWGFTNPSEFSDTIGYGSRSSWKQLNIDDLWRATCRYKESYELAHYYACPIDGITLFLMTDARGVAKHLVDFNDMRIETRPDLTTIGYTFMRRGYLPNKAQLLANSKQSHLDLEIVLTPDPGSPAPSPSYVTTFDRIRHELMDTGINERMSKSNLKRLDRIRLDLEKAAEEALTAGDRHSAALIWARMETLPGLVLVDGQIVGFQQTDTASGRSRAAIRKAIQLDPDNPYLAFRALREQGRSLIERLSYPMTANDREEMTAFVENEKTLLDRYGDHAWMFDRLGLFYGYSRLGQYDKAYLELKKLQAIEPRGADYQEMLDGLKLKKEINKEPIPTNWNL